jgi:hypothetical protein
MALPENLTAAKQAMGSEVSLEIGKSRLAQRLTVWPRRDG